MHCLFLGIAKWIVKRIWIDQGKLTTSVLNEVQRKMNQFSIPADIGRIPGKIYCGEGFSNFTANQWKIFFTIYATVSLWDHLEYRIVPKISTPFLHIMLVKVLILLAKFVIMLVRGAYFRGVLIFGTIRYV
jgi:hypothetical protein